MLIWEKVELGKSADIYRGGSPRPIQAYLTQSRNGVNWIKIGDVASNAKYISATEEKIIPEGAAFSRSVSKGDFILSNSMSFGRPYILRIDGCIHDGWLTVQNYQENFDTDFLYYVLGSEETLQQYISMAAGSSVQNLNKGKVSRVIVVKPPLPEQRRIAEALSDTDALLTATEKLIAKKRAIKQGAMQELLTGKRRLPVFKGEWMETTLGAMGDFSKGRGISKDEAQSGTLPCVRYGEIYTHHNDYVKEFNSFITEEVAQNSRYLRTGELLFAGSGETKEEIGKCVAFTKKCEAYVGGDIIILTPRTKVDSLFLGFYLNSQPIAEQKESRGQGDAIVHISAASLANIEMQLPSFAEQTAIAEILSDMDAEIDALTAKLNKLRDIKRGMMSELLTGRIRLADSIPAKATVEAYPEQEAEPIHKVAEDIAPKGHTQQFDDAVMIAGIVNVLYSVKYPLGRKKVQKCLYLLRRRQHESTEAFKKKAAGPYADEVRYKGGEPIARRAKYIATTSSKQGTTFARGKNIGKALDYIQSWGKEADIKWVADNLKFRTVEELELLATVDMAICDLSEVGMPVSVQSIKRLIAAESEWIAKLKKQTFSDDNIARAIQELKVLLRGGN